MENKLFRNVNPRKVFVPEKVENLFKSTTDEIEKNSSAIALLKSAEFRKKVESKENSKKELDKNLIYNQENIGKVNARYMLNLEMSRKLDELRSKSGQDRKNVELLKADAVELLKEGKNKEAKEIVEKVNKIENERDKTLPNRYEIEEVKKDIEANNEEKNKVKENILEKNKNISEITEKENVIPEPKKGIISKIKSVFSKKEKVEEIDKEATEEPEEKNKTYTSKEKLTMVAKKVKDAAKNKIKYKYNKIKIKSKAAVDLAFGDKDALKNDAKEYVINEAETLKSNLKKAYEFGKKATIYTAHKLKGIEENKKEDIVKSPKKKLVEIEER